jgi:hypothetical protein
MQEYSHHMVISLACKGFPLQFAKALYALMVTNIVGILNVPSEYGCESQGTFPSSCPNGMADTKERYGMAYVTHMLCITRTVLKGWQRGWRTSGRESHDAGKRRTRGWNIHVSWGWLWWWMMWPGGTNFSLLDSLWGNLPDKDDMTQSDQPFAPKDLVIMSVEHITSCLYSIYHFVQDYQGLDTIRTSCS